MFFVENERVAEYGREMIMAGQILIPSMRRLFGLKTSALLLNRPPKRG